MASNEVKLGIYEMMNRMNIWEQRLLLMMEQGLVSGFYHSGRGQEGVQAAAVATLRPDDYLMYAHRGCGYMIAKGLSMAKLYGDFLANLEGTTRGLGAGIVHIAWPELGILGQSGSIGGCFPIAGGAAFSAKYRGTDQVCLCFFGDGTSSRGTFHESLNVASVQKLPVVWLCENNGWAISTPASRTISVENIADRACAYNMPGVIVDGMDAVAVYDAVEEAVARARKGEGPTLIEAKCVRLRGHFEGDAQGYRDPEDVQACTAKDPIPALAARLIAEGIATQADFEAIRAKLLKEVDEAAEVALKAPKPPDSRILDDVYA